MTPGITSRLINSIKVVDDGVEMYDYGEHHHYGIGEPKREFIGQAGSSEMKSLEEVVEKDFFKRVNKAMKK